jgi:hypothetical protein
MDQFPLPTAMSPDAARRINEKWSRALDGGSNRRDVEAG